MPKLVNSSLFIVHGHKKTINHQPSTINRNSTGFTLIELLIVIALIGIIGSIGFYGYQSSQQKARDAQRKSDLQMVKRALESAKNDCLASSYYPDAGGADETAAFITLSNHLIDTDLNYLPQTISDPKNTSPYVYTYHKSASATNLCIDDAGTINNYSGIKYYVLQTMLEITNDPDSAKSYDACQTTIGLVSFGTTPSRGDGYYYVCPD